MSVKFKIGDRVELMCSSHSMYSKNMYGGKLGKGHIGLITDISDRSVKVDNEGSCCWIDKSQITLVPEYPNPPHKHSEAIKAWADGAEIQFVSKSGRWKDISDPGWLSFSKYRVKPQKSEKEIKLEELEAKAQELADEIKELRSSEK